MTDDPSSLSSGAVVNRNVRTILETFFRAGTLNIHHGEAGRNNSVRGVEGGITASEAQLPAERER